MRLRNFNANGPKGESLINPRVGTANPFVIRPYFPGSVLRSQIGTTSPFGPAVSTRSAAIAVRLRPDLSTVFSCNRPRAGERDLDPPALDQPFRVKGAPRPLRRRFDYRRAFTAPPLPPACANDGFVSQRRAAGDRAIRISAARQVVMYREIALIGASPACRSTISAAWSPNDGDHAANYDPETGCQRTFCQEATS